LHERALDTVFYMGLADPGPGLLGLAKLWILHTLFLFSVLVLVLSFGMSGLCIRYDIAIPICAFQVHESPPSQTWEYLGGASQGLILRRVW
jgi:hypothetical protein